MYVPWQDISDAFKERSDHTLEKSFADWIEDGNTVVIGPEENPMAALTNVDALNAWFDNLRNAGIDRPDPKDDDIDGEYQAAINDHKS